MSIAQKVVGLVRSYLGLFGDAVNGLVFQGASFTVKSAGGSLTAVTINGASQSAAFSGGVTCVTFSASSTSAFTGLGTFSGFIQDAAGQKRMTTAPTNATATMSSGVLADLSITLVAGRKYTGVLVLWAKNSTAGEGLQVDFNGGAATMTSFQAGIGGAPGATVGTATTTALATAVTLTNMGSANDVTITIPIALVCNAGGTFIPRFAEVSHSTGTATVEIGSYLKLDDMAA